MTMDASDRLVFLRSFLKARAALDGRNVLLSFVGNVYELAPNGAARLAFGIEGVNAARVETINDGYRMLTREVAVYTDPQTGQLLETWQNPASEIVTVEQMRNDPVNQLYLVKEAPAFPVRVHESPHDVCFTFDALLSYPSPLTPDEYPLESPGDTYYASELLQFSAPKEQLSDAGASSPCHVSWTRTSPWLPWMKMGQRPGFLLYHCHGSKLDTADELPTTLADYIKACAPEFLTAPEGWRVPNQTTWTRFRDVSEDGQTAVAGVVAE